MGLVVHDYAVGLYVYMVLGLSGFIGLDQLNISVIAI